MQARYMNLHNIDARLAQMDERGIDVSVLSFNPPNCTGQIRICRGKSSGLRTNRWRTFARLTPIVWPASPPWRYNILRSRRSNWKRA